VTLDWSTLASAQRSVAAIVEDAILQESERSSLMPDELQSAAFDYLRRGGKRLRPLLFFLSAGAAGGDPERFRSAALAVEVFHTWTLIHDDIIDNDDERRGGPSVHAAYRDRIAERLPEQAGRAAEFGLSVGILSGDFLSGLAVRLVMDGAAEGGARPETAVAAARLMVEGLVADLVQGEMLDVAFTYRPVAEVTEAELIEMHRRKTATLMDYSARIGAMLALDTHDGTEGLPATLAAFAERCGVAFQLQDDVLGIVGDAARLGKPVGSDIREGKRTAVLLHAYANAGGRERAMMERILGNREATEAEIARVRDLLVERGGIAHAQQLAREHVDAALNVLRDVPDSPYRRLLEALPGAMIHRDT